MKNFIDVRDFSQSEIEAMLQLSEKIKCGEDQTRYLDGLSLGLLFSQASTRTRISFQLAIHQLGGYSEFYKMSDLQLSNHESMEDTAGVLGRYLDALIVRDYDMNCYGDGRRSLLEIAEHAKIPIVNALDDKGHPCQAMADILTIKEKLGEAYKERKCVLTWAYAERKKSPGVPHSLLSLGALLGMNFTVAFPKNFELDAEFVNFAEETKQVSGAKIEYTNDLEAACDNADVIYAKSWKALHSTPEEDTAMRNDIRSSWMVDTHHFDIANNNAIFMNCMPLIRGQQASAEIVDGKHSVLLDQAENRIHAQKGVLATILGGE